MRFFAFLTLVLCTILVCSLPFIVAYAPEQAAHQGHVLLTIGFFAPLIGLGSMVILCDN
tara:strand:- start:290 stop:466 length:177 start_codon:yes stop_codon:yes gene_type:complete